MSREFIREWQVEGGLRGPEAWVNMIYWLVWVCTIFFFCFLNHWPAYFTFRLGILIHRAEWQTDVKLSIVIENESPGLGVRTESKCNFPALICFHYLSKAIVSLFSFHKSVWYERMMLCRREEEKGQTLLVSSSSFQQTMWWCVLHWKQLQLNYHFREASLLVFLNIIHYCSPSGCVCLCACSHVKTLSLTALQHWEQAWSHHPQWTQWICSEVFRTTRK